MTEYDVYCGLDVGKEAHHAVALDDKGKRLHDAALPQDEARLRALFDKLARRGRVLVIVDQPASIGALPVTVARAAGVQVSYLPGLAMRRIADLFPGNAKTDLLTELRRETVAAWRREPTRASTVRCHGRGQRRGAGSVPFGGRGGRVVAAHRGSVRAVPAR
jgi:Transposase